MSSSCGENLLKLLSTSKILDVPSERDLVSIDSNASLGSAFEKLCKNGIHSAPVIDESGEAIGLLDAKDFVSYVVQLYAEKADGETSPKKNASELSDFSRKNPFLAVGGDALLQDALKEFVRLNYVHRVPIIKVGDSSGRVVERMLSHSAVLQFVHSRRDKIAESLVLTLDDVEDVAFKSVYAVRDDQTLFDAFSLIDEHGVNAVPVVDAKRRIVGNVSATDLRHSVLANLGALSDTCAQFLADAADDPQRKSAEPITCRPDATIGSILDALVGNSIHHVWAVDDDGAPVGVVSSVDIIQAFVAIALSHVLSSMLSADQ
jgi:CBS domain-containing protein